MLGTSEETLRSFMKTVNMIFTTVLIGSVSRALQLGVPVHEWDIERCVDDCDETLLEIEMKPFIQAVCGHVKDFKLKETCKRKSDAGKEKVSDSSDVKCTDFPLSLLQLHKPCDDLVALHSLLHEKFIGIITSSFQSVPANLDYHFYCPPEFFRNPQVRPVTHGGFFYYDIKSKKILKKSTCMVILFNGQIFMQL